jgi:hypothetical protein
MNVLLMKLLIKTGQNELVKGIISPCFRYIHLRFVRLYRKINFSTHSKREIEFSR